MPDSHREDQILDAVVAKIGVDTSAETNVYRDPARELPADTVMAISVVDGNEDPPDFVGNAFIDCWMNFHLDLITKTAQPTDRKSGAKPAYVTNLMALRKETHVKLMADITQGLAFVIDTEPFGADAPEFSGDGEAVIATRRTNWRIKYRSSVGDPSA